MRWNAIFLTLVLGLTPAIAGEPATGDPAAAGVGITEATGYARNLSLPTAGQPVYVSVHPGGQYDFGQVPGGEHAPAAAALGQDLTEALDRIHYLAADPGHPPSLLIVFNWGTHCALANSTGDAGYRNLYDRAALIGGERFCGELKTAIDQTVDSTGSISNRPWGVRMPGMGAQTPAQLLDGVSPIEMFRKRDPLNRRLLDLVADDCYYVVVSAFDYSTVNTERKRLLWRTKLTVPTRSVSMMAAIPALIAHGDGYFGREMNAAEFFADHRR